MMTKLAVDPDGKLGDSCNPAPCIALMVGLAGHILAAVAVQLTFVQLKPVAMGSVNVVPGAAAGPRFAIVTV